MRFALVTLAAAAGLAAPAHSSAHGRGAAVAIGYRRRPGEITGSFVRVARPALWPWLVGVAAFGAAVWAVATRSAHRLTLTPRSASRSCASAVAGARRPRG